MEDVLDIPVVEEQQQDPPLKKLYKGLVGDKKYTKSYDDFVKQYSTPEAIDKLHKGLVEDGDYTKDINEFQKQYFQKTSKKKVGSVVIGENYSSPELDSETHSTSKIPTVVDYGNGDLIPDNSVDLSKKAIEYLGKTKEVSNDDLRNNAAITKSVPDEDAIGVGKKIMADLEKKGIGRDFIDAISDLPDEAYNDPNTSKETLSELYKDNRIKFHQFVNEQKNRLAIKKGASENQSNANNGIDDIDPNQMGVHVGNQYLGTYEEQRPKNIYELQNIVRKKQDIINRTLSGDESVKAQNRLRESYSSYINPSNPEIQVEYEESPLKSKVDLTQYSALKTLQLFDPEKYEQAVNILNTDIEKQYTFKPQFENFQSPVAASPSVTTSDSTLAAKNKGSLSAETIDQQIGKETVLRQLTQLGRDNLVTQINSQQYDLEKAFNSTDNPEEKEAIKQQYVANQDKLIEVKVNAAQDKVKFPLTSKMEFDNQVKELTQDAGIGALEYGSNKFLHGVGTGTESLEDMATNLFGSEKDKALLGMKRLGESKWFESKTYLPEDYKRVGSPFIMQPSKQLKDEAKKIMGDKSLSELSSDQRKQLTDLVANNQDQIETVTNPDAGKSKNFFSKSTLFSNAGFIGDIGAFMYKLAGAKSLGLSGKTAELVTLYNDGYSAAHNQAIAEGKSESAANEYGVLHGGVMLLAGTVSSKFEAVKDMLVTSKSPLSKQILGLGEKGWDAIVNKNKSTISKIASGASSVIGSNAKMIATYGVGVSIANDLADKGFFNKNISFDEISDNAKHSAIDMAIGSVGLAGIGFISHAMKNPISLKDKTTIWEIGDNPEISKIRIDEAIARNELTQSEGDAKKKTIDNIASLIGKVPTENSKWKPLTDKQKVQYLYNSILKDKGNEAAKDLPDTQSEKAEHIALVADHANALIFEPKTDKQLESRLSQIEKELTPEKKEDGTVVPINEKLKQDLLAEQEAINNQIEFNKRYEKITKPEVTETAEIPITEKEGSITDTEPNKTEPAASEGQGGKFEAKARKIADKIINSETPSWLKIDDPNIKKKGIGENEIKKALADATIKMGKLLDKGVEFKDAVKEAVKELVDMMGEGRRSDIEKGFEKQYNEQLGEDNRTGIKKEVTNEVRQSRGLPKVEFPKMGTDTAELEAAKKRVDSGESNPIESVQSILNEKRGYKDEAEAFDMQYYAHQLDKHNENLSRQLAEAKTPEEHSEILNQKMQLSDEIDAQTEAAQLAGNKWGKIGNAMQPVINDAGRIFRNDKQIIQDVYGENMPPKVKMQIDTLTKERDEAIAAKIKVEEQLRQKMAEKGFEKVKEQARKTAKRSETKEALKKEEDELLKELKQSIKKDLGNVNSGIPIPKETLETLGKLAVNYFKQGVNGVEALVDRLYEGLKDTGISRSQIKEAVANYEPLTIARETERLNKKADLLMDKVTPPSVKTTGNKFKPSEQVDLTKPSKEQLTFRKSNEWVKANQRVANAEFRMKILKRKAFESEKNYYQRALAWVGRLTRLSVLSGYNVLAKLAAALTVGGGMKRIPEQAIGAVYSKIFQKIANQAPIEGQNNWLNAKAEAAFYKDFFNPKKFAQNSWDILKTGSTKLGRRLGSAEYEHVPILYIPTDLHQIIKDPLKRATFESSFKNHMIWAEKNGLDINDPLVVNSIENAAYKRAQYEIFQESNKLSRWFTSQKAALEKKGNIGNTAKFVVDFLIPVSTVPANIVRRVTTTSPLGLIRGGKEVISAYRNGIEKLTPEQADHVMQQLKQGTLGTALWLVGWYGYQSFGGLYSQFNPNKKREEGDKMSDVMVVDGHEIPKPVQHALPLEVIQLASTARRIYENYRENKNASMPEALYKAGLGSIGAMAEQIPVIETPVHAVMATKDPVEADKFKEDMERRIKPQILREFGVFNNEFKKSKEGKFLEDKQNKIVDLHKEAVHPLDKEGNKVKVSEEMFNKLTQVRESKIQDEISKLMSKGADVWDGNKNTHVEAKDMTPAQVKDWLMKTSTKAKKEAMDEVFGEQPEPTEKPEIETAN